MPMDSKLDWNYWPGRNQLRSAGKSSVAPSWAHRTCACVKFFNAGCAADMEGVVAKTKASAHSARGEKALPPARTRGSQRGVCAQYSSYSAPKLRRSKGSSHRG